MAVARHMTTTAEGVETKQQQKLLRMPDCSEMQGYLFSPAKPAAEIERLFFTHTKKSAVVAPDGVPAERDSVQKKLLQNKLEPVSFGQNRGGGSSAASLEPIRWFCWPNSAPWFWAMPERRL